MNIIVTACHVPFIGGGASYHIAGLTRELENQGHQVELVRLPFQFQPESAVRATMQFSEQLDLSRPNGQSVDRVISLQFPAYGAQHPRHVVWLMHQYRAVYELYDPALASPEQQALRAEVLAFDTRVLARACALFSNSPRVSERLLQFNGLDSEPLAHPPPLEEHYRWAPAKPYIFCPSRLESLKRQDLLIEAARHLRSPVGIVIAGEGGQEARYRALVEELGVQDRVQLVGHISEAEKIAFYANALGVFFAPFDEDYGYITLEAMLSSKPVLTCHDSGGPLAFVEEGVTGRVLAPDPQAIADAIDALHAAPEQALAMGRRGREAYRALNLNWAQVVQRLLAA